MDSKEQNNFIRHYRLRDYSQKPNYKDHISGASRITYTPQDLKK